jgi:hypothetical protein
MQLTKAGEVKAGYSVAFWFTVVGALFIALSPQYFGFIFPVIFLLPICMGIKALKYRRKTGLYLALGVVPLSVSIASIWMRYVVTVINSGNVAVSAGTTPTLFYIFSFLAVVLSVSCVVLIVKLIKYRSIFNS